MTRFITMYRSVCIIFCTLVSLTACTKSEPLDAHSRSLGKTEKIKPRPEPSEPTLDEETPLSPNPPKDEDKPIGGESNKHQPLPTPKVEVLFADGVSYEGGWYDADKLKRPEDIMACWLISASNMLQWWQDRYTEAGGKLPSGTPDGIGTGPYQLAIFDSAMASFTQLNYGGDISNAISWYIKGSYPNITGHARPRRNSGGYLRSVPTQRISYPERSFLSYDDWASLSESKEVLRVFTTGITQKLRGGAVLGMDIKTHVGLGGGLHAITVWGAELNPEKDIVAIYITDSDDFEKRLVRCPVEVVKDSYWGGFAIAMNIPVSDAYPAGATWAVLRLTHLSHQAA